MIEFLVYTGLFLSLYFGIFVFLTFSENRKRVYLKEKNYFPSVSLIVPCYNEEENIETILQSLYSLNYPKEKLEIIAVDDGSKDNTLKEMEEFQEKQPSLKIFHKDNGGKHTALNLGITHSKGELIGCVDADCEVEKEALRKMVKYFEKEVDIVISTIKIMHPKNILEGVQYAEYLMSSFLKKIFSFLGSISVTPGPLSLFKRGVLKELGPYKKAYLTEDLEMALRAQTKNLKIVHALESVVYTKAQKTLRGLCRQRLRWRRGFLLNLNDYRNLLNIKKHGNLSVLLFYNLFGALLTISLISYTLYKFFNFVFEKLNNAFLINFDFYPYLADLSWPSINVRPVMMLGILGLLIILCFLLLGKKLTFDKESLKKKALIYLLAYSFLNGIWWVLAGFSILLKREIAWQ